MKSVKLTILLLVISANVVIAQKMKFNENNCLKLTEQELIAIGFLIEKDNIRYECILPGGISFFFQQTMNSFSTMLMNNENKDSANAKYFPVLLSNLKGEVFFSFNYEDPNNKFLPIIFETLFFHKGSNKNIFVFKYTDELRGKLPKIDNIDKYLVQTL